MMAGINVTVDGEKLTYDQGITLAEIADDRYQHHSIVLGVVRLSHVSPSNSIIVAALI